MKTIYKSFAALICAFALTTAVYGAQTVVKTMQLGDGITTSGIVRVVVKVTEQHVGRDLGVILHQTSPYPLSWDHGIGIMMFENLYAATPNTSQLRGYDGTGAGAFNSVNIKNITKGTTIALWFTIDIAAKTHSLSYQLSTETAPTVLYTNYISRSSLKLQPSANAQYCTVFINDLAATTANGGLANTTAAIEVVSDAVIVPSIEAYNFTTNGLELNNSTGSFSVYPTLATDFINISADEEISSVKIISLDGKKVYEGKYNNQIEVSALKSGSYVIEAKTISNNVLRKTFLKK
jgi:hypothetical protein